MSEQQFDLLAGVQARDRGMKQVTDNNRRWHDIALDKLWRLSGSNREMTAEEMRAWLRANGLADPSHPNAWGALTGHAVKMGLIEDTGKVTQARDKKSHACRVPVWRFK